MFSAYLRERPVAAADALAVVHHAMPLKKRDALIKKTECSAQCCTEEAAYRISAFKI